MANINNMRADIMQAFGQTAQPVEHPIQKEEIMSFSKSGVRVNFNLNAYWNEAKGVNAREVTLEGTLEGDTVGGTVHHYKGYTLDASLKVNGDDFKKSVEIYYV